MKRLVPTAVAIFSGLVVLVGFFVDHEVLGHWPNLLIEGATVLAAFALLMGAMNLVIVHGRRALESESHGGYGLVLVVAMVITFALGVLSPGTNTLAWIFDYMYAPLHATMTALLAFFAVSGAYRAFRIRHAGAAILLATSLFMLLAQLAFSERISPLIPAMRQWLLAIPVTAGVRGILFGTALGIMGTSLRILTGIDRPYAQE